MIDYIALAIGHGLIATALLRMFLREAVDIDPQIDGMDQQLRAQRLATSSAGRREQRRGDHGEAGESSAPGDAPATAHQNPLTRPRKSPRKPGARG